MICHISPSIRCSRTSTRSPLPMLTTEHPIPFAELMTILLFSVMWNAFRLLIFFPGLFRTRSSMVSGTLSLMSFASTRPSLQSSNISNVSVGKGRRCPMSGSPASTALMCLVNSVRSSSLIVCVTLADEPFTWILPDTLPDGLCPAAGGLPLPVVAPPAEAGCCAEDGCRTFEMSCANYPVSMHSASGQNFPGRPQRSDSTSHSHQHSHPILPSSSCPTPPL